MRLASSLLVLTLAAPGFAQTTWYVDAAAAPPGSGTLASPYASIQYAVAQPTTVSGDVVLVAPGTYTEQVLIVGKAIVVKSSGGPLLTTIKAAAVGPVVGIAPPHLNASIVGFSIVGDPSLVTTGIELQGGSASWCIVRDHHDPDGNAGYGIDGSFDGGASFGHCTVIHNDVGAFGPSLGAFNASNSIVAFNGLDMASVDASYSLWGTGIGGFGPGNAVGDPKFWDLSQGDLHLGFGSPCIDSGNPALPLDPDGSRVDMGAVTFDAGYLPSITSYCTGKVHSQGCVAAIGTSGGAAASVSSPTPFLVTAVSAPQNKPGLFFYSRDRQIKPFQGGFHCVKLPSKRTHVQFSGAGAPCAGAFSLDFNAWLQTGEDPSLGAGQVIDGQWWFRDPLDPAGFGAGTSDAIEFPIGL